MDRGTWRASVHGAAESDTTEVTEHACSHSSIITTVLCGIWKPTWFSVGWTAPSHHYRRLNIPGLCPLNMNGISQHLCWPKTTPPTHDEVCACVSVFACSGGRGTVRKICGAVAFGWGLNHAKKQRSLWPEWWRYQHDFLNCTWPGDPQPYLHIICVLIKGNENSMINEMLYSWKEKLMISKMSVLQPINL